MTDDSTVPPTLPSHEEPGETLRPVRPVAPNPATAPTLIRDAAKPRVAHDGHARSRKLGPYTLVRLLGRGGMGAVWEALDTRLDRRVALKVMVAGEQASEQETERFRREAQNSAKLRHPNIVPVHDFGIAAGQLYLVMDLVDGVMLADALRQRQFTYREKAFLLEKVSRAVQYAHEQGVVHRDLKPSNIMLELAKGGSTSGDAKPGSSTNVALPANERAVGEPLVMDFGLAKDIARDSSLSHSGQVMGTPAYMPPEQAEGKGKLVGPPADVYSLGAVFYEMLTGRPPFSGESALQILRAVIFDEPLRPRHIVPAVPQDLETICLKCLEKAPAKRYGSAQALAEDLARWLSNEPIVARASSPWEKTAKWVRRRPTAAALIAVSVVALLSLIGGGLWYNAQLVAERDKARTAAANEKAEAQRARAAETKATQKETEARRRLAESLVSQADALFLAGRPVESLDRYNEARSTLAGLGEPTFPVEAGIFELRCSYPACILTFGGHSAQVSGVAFSPDGKLALSGSWDRALKLWDVATGRELWTFTGHTAPVWGVAFSPDGKLALSGSWDRTLKLWDVATGRELRTFSGHNGAVRSVAFSPDGKVALSGSDDETLKLWDVGTGRALRTLSGHTDLVYDVAFSPDGKLALSASFNQPLKLWDLATGRELWKSSSDARGVAFSPDGKLALSGTWDHLNLWDVATGRELRTFGRGLMGIVPSVAFSPDGKMALSGSADNTVRLWEVVTGRELRTFSGHTKIVGRVAFSHDGKLVLSASEDKTVRVWDMATVPEVRTFGTGTRTRGAFSPDGKLALSGSEDKLLKLWDVATGRELRTFRGLAGPVSSVAFSPDGKMVLAASCWDRTLKLWDVATGREMRTFSGHTEVVFSVAFSPDGRLALSGGGDCTLKLWDVTTGSDLRTFSGHANAVWSIAFSPDGKLAFSGSVDQTVKLWDVATGRELRTFSDNTGLISSVVLSPDGNLVLSGTMCNAHLRDFSRPARHREFDALLPKAREALQKNENDAEALKTFGEWYAFRGKNDWAVDFLEKARQNGAHPDTWGLTLARCYWQVGDPPHCRAAAAEFQKELSRVKAQPLPIDARGKSAREQNELYLELCLASAAGRIAAEAAAQAEAESLAAKQVEAVVAALKAKNPAFNGKTEHRIEQGQVTYFGTREETLADISPICALTALEELGLNHTGVADLSPIRELKLKRLWIGATQVADLAPLKDMPLEVINCGCYKVTDLAPLQGAPLKEVYLEGSGASDLSPLAGKALAKLHISRTKVRDLAPLAGALLTEIMLEGSQVTDLAPLKNMPLQEIKLDFQGARDTGLLLSIATLKQINGMPAPDFWAGVAKDDKAAEWVRSVIEKNPRLLIAYNYLYMILKAKGDSAGVVQLWRTCAAANPDSAEALNGCAWELLTSSDEKLRDAKAALPLAQKAAELTKHENCNILDTLALALFRNGRKEEAIETEKKAIALLPANTPPDTRREFEKNLEEFSGGKQPQK
ncbi:MAG: protein kinase [Planctomycetota bacterium]